jgi:hypothetical protein
MTRKADMTNRVDDMNKLITQLEEMLKQLRTELALLVHDNQGDWHPEIETVALEEDG